MQKLVPGWSWDVERGPDWLYVRLRSDCSCPADRSNVAEHLWSLLEQHFIYRVVLELNELTTLSSPTLGQLVKLYKRIHQHGGLLRLCGLSDANREVLRTSQLGNLFPQFRSREEAVMGFRPAQPR